MSYPTVLAAAWFGVLSAHIAWGGDAVSAADFRNPERVTILGFSDHAMEPFVTRDGRYLLFNNLKSPAVNTNLHHAERIDDLTFEYRGELGGVNTPALEGVPSLDLGGTLYFVSPRSYAQTLSTIHRGVFAAGQVGAVELVPGISLLVPGWVNFDVEVSPDGNTLYFVDALFGPTGPQTADYVVARRVGSSFERLANSSELMNLVNTAALEYAAAISANGRSFLFTRAGAGPNGEPAIFLATRASTTGAFGAPEWISAINGFVEAPTLSPDERSLYYHRREGALFAIYRVTRAPAAPGLRPAGIAALSLALGTLGCSVLVLGARGRSSASSRPGAAA